MANALHNSTNGDETWTGPTGIQHRYDYVGVTPDLFHSIVKSEVCFEVDLTTKKEDHKLVLAEFKLVTKVKEHTDVIRRGKLIANKALHDPLKQ